MPVQSGGMDKISGKVLREGCGRLLQESEARSIKRQCHQICTKCM